MKFQGRIINVKQIKGLLGGIKALELSILDNRKFVIKVTLDEELARDYARYLPDRELRGKGGQPRIDMLPTNLANRKVFMELDILEKY